MLVVLVLCQFWFKKQQLLGSLVVLLVALLLTEV